MRIHDSTQPMVITCHSLDHDDDIKYIQADTWRQVLDVLWPMPYCVILRRTEGDRAFLAFRLDSDKESVVYRAGSTPEEARDALRQEWRSHLEHHPEEMARRYLEPARRLLERRGFRTENNWEEMILDMGKCHTHLEARQKLNEFLYHVAPFLGERDRLRILIMLERISFIRIHQAAEA